MVCDICKIKMNDSTTEMEVFIKGKMIKAVNVPSLSCPKCNKLLVESFVEKQVQLYAKHCKGDTFNYNDVEPRGVGITIGKV